MMPFVYREVDGLQDEPLVGNGDCVTLIKEKTSGLQGIPTHAWRQGESVLESTNLKRGTAIATFENGRYAGRPTGNHAAFFLARAGKAIWVMDQWKDDPINKPTVSKRLIHPGRTKKDGTLRDPSNSSQAFFVIERR